ncbi:polyADP-ribose polymerase [Tupanvirus soda lake]|uniref:NAD(+) ADP-ribosyltransferase n=2 Tax=Tupanvirus TaxID=2094720 RepID=A0A6N1P1W9_9VIRU|nr:polyADP-ribose polymerase [Tupanvirus soda lake]QKU35031.1 polyADP-ribose polymerase [Tupanvirus soda lake]
MSKVTVSTKGHLIDPNCKYNTGTIVESNGSVYDCTLNQTDIKSNKNKFYIMQLIENGNKYIVYVRYGRIGEVGRIDYKEYSSESMAISFFEKQFRSKTGNSWYDKDNFVKKDGKYFMAEIERAEISEEDASDTDDSDSDEEVVLDERVIDFVKLITNTTFMKNTLIELEIDTEKMPLGKISQDQIDSAYEILNEINGNLNDQAKLVKLSSEFYTLIPYACGRQKPPVINTPKLVGKNINLLNELSQMVYGSKAVTKLKKDKGNLMKLYQDLNTEIVPLDETDDMYQILVEYLLNSKAPTHHFQFEVLNIFEINREMERDAYDAYSTKLKNKTLLFHGTRVTNLCGILKNGLVVDPSKLGINVNITGKMFGLGLYFANSCSKSIQYCAYDNSDNIACLFVAEVALGKMLEKKFADVLLTAKTMPKGYHSTWGMGKSSFAIYDEYDDGTRIPSGKLQPMPKSSDRSLLYDEFIVYHEEQINLRYIILLKVDDDY